MTDVHSELKKTNKAVKPPIEFTLPLFITNTDWRAEFCDGMDWCEDAWRQGWYRLGLTLIVVMIIAAIAGFLWALITH